jgi:hypothetical protein
MRDNTPELWFDTSPLVVPGELGKQVALILDGKPRTFTFTVPANKADIQPCVWCGVSVLPCQLENGRDYDAEIFTDEDGVLRVDVTSPHTCPEAERYQEFLGVDSEEQTGDDLEDEQ